MSSKKKDDKDKKGKKAQKDLEKERLEQQQARKQQERQQAQKRIQVLQTSGILDAYEYFLRAICKNGLPQANIFEFAAQQVLKYQKKMKQQEGKKQQIRNFNRSVLDQPPSSKLDKSQQKLKPSVSPTKAEPLQQSKARKIEKK